MLHHRLFKQPPAALALPTPSVVCYLSPRSPLLPCDRVSPCALVVFLWKCSHLHGLACNQVLPWLLQLSIALCSCSIPQAMFASIRALVAIALCSRNVPQATLALSWGSINDRATIVVGLPLLSGCHHCWATIVVRPPLLLGYHCCWAAVVVGLSLAPHFLELPPNGLFVVGLQCCPILLGCLWTPCLLSSLGYRCCPVPFCANSLSAYPANPIAFSYALFVAFCCCHVCQESPCRDGKPHVCPTAPWAGSSWQTYHQALPRCGLVHETSQTRPCVPNQQMALSAPGINTVGVQLT